MRALLLAAGPGTRLRPITDTTPKCLVEIDGRPLLDYWLETLLGGPLPQVDRVLINTCHLSGMVWDHVRRSPWRSQIDLVHEPSLLGTAGTLRMNRDWFGNQPFLVAHADNLTDLKPVDLLVAHALRPNRCLMTMMAFKTDRPESCGILKTCDRVLIGFDEKPTAPSGPLANAAVYVFEPFLDIIGSWQANEIVTDIIPRLLGRIFVHEHQGYHRDIGSPESLALARQEWLTVKGESYYDSRESIETRRLVG